MPDCIDCRWREGDRCAAYVAGWPRTPINDVRACTIAINDEYCALIEGRHRILEIGVGHWSPLRERCEKMGAHWEGIDIRRVYEGRATLATRIEPVDDLSFEDDQFDYVIGTQALEHWNETGTRIELGLWQCFRVCKPGGWVMMNVPLHVHGSHEFVLGDLEAIRSRFSSFSPQIHLETWRKKSDPFQKIHLIPRRFTNGEPAYNLDIRARVPSQLPRRPRPYTIRSRFIRDLADHSLGYLAYLVQRKIRLGFAAILRRGKVRRKKEQPCP